MSVATPKLSHPPLELPDLTLPQEAPRTAKRVLGLYLQRTWQRWQSLPLGALAVHNRGLYQQTLALLKSASQTLPHLPLQLLRWPTLSTLITCIHDQLVPGGDLGRANQWVREACALWLLELAHARLLPATGVLVPRDSAGQLPVLRSVAANLCLIAGPNVTGWHFGPGQLEVHSHTGKSVIPLSDQEFDLASVLEVTASRPYFEIVPGIVLATSDNNPLSDFEAHPDKHGNQLDLGGHPAQEWCDVLRQCLQLIDEHLPLLGQELRLILRVVVPVGWDPERHLSASYQEAVGLIYLTLHPNLMTMTEAVVHEYQHNKINAAFAMDPLLHNAWSPLYASPVRPDPRPLHGVVLAVHAFQPVAKLYEAMDAAAHQMARNPSWQERFRKIIGLNREGSLTVLSHAEATETGRGLFAEMRALDDHFAAFEAQHWPA